MRTKALQIPLLVAWLTFTLIGSRSPEDVAGVGVRANGTVAYVQSVAGETPEPITDIFVVNADGSGSRRVTRDQIDAVCLDWSPDGRKFVVTTNRYRSGGNVILVMNRNGGGRRKLTPRGNWAGAAWSPDGRTIVYAIRDRRADGAHKGLYAMNTDGKHKRRLTTKDDHLIGWSPDGRRIALERVVHIERVFAGEVRSELHVVNSDGSRDRRIHTTKRDSDFALSPDWRKVAFVRYHDTPARNELHVMDFNGQRDRKITRGRVDDCCVSWAPNARRFAFRP